MIKASRTLLVLDFVQLQVVNNLLTTSLKNSFNSCSHQTLQWGKSVILLTLTVGMFAARQMDWFEYFKTAGQLGLSLCSLSVGYMYHMS